MSHIFKLYTYIFLHPTCILRALSPTTNHFVRNGSKSQPYTSAIKKTAAIFVAKPTNQMPKCFPYQHSMQECVISSTSLRLNVKSSSFTVINISLGFCSKLHSQIKAREKVSTSEKSAPPPLKTNPTGKKEKSKQSELRNQFLIYTH